MDELTYLLYDGGVLLAGFTMMVTAINFAESWRTNSDIPIDLVNGRTGEILDTYILGAWENRT